MFKELRGAASDINAHILSMCFMIMMSMLMTVTTLMSRMIMMMMMVIMMMMMMMMMVVRAMMIFLRACYGLAISLSQSSRCTFGDNHVAASCESIL